MGRTYPALDVRCDDADVVLALVDDFHPTAAEDHDDGAARFFFATATDRDAAREALESRYHVEPLDVPDEDWARRSQENLQPITIGRLTVFPNPESLIPNPCFIVIRPSMGFGTGHHATTQLCLEALQTLDLRGAHLVDVGTGSGVLAIAAACLGASRALGIDVDEDAIAAARDNLALNPDVADRVAFEVADLTSLRGGDSFKQSWGPPSGGPEVRLKPDATGVGTASVPTIVTANLTGALLVRSAATLIASLPDGGILILSGLQLHERDDVARAFAGTSTAWERTAGEWVGLAMKKP